MTRKNEIYQMYSKYRECFLTSAKSIGAKLHQYPHPLAGPLNEPLFTDVALVGDLSATNQVVIISGTHGVEGYYGSKAQTSLLDELKDEKIPENISILLIHLINPWGSAWLRRVNEDNIDLNRNYIDFSSAAEINKKYADYHSIYNFKEISGSDKKQSDEKLRTIVKKIGWTNYHNTIEAGQYNYPDGIFYGGKAPSWSNLALKKIISEHSSKADNITFIDLHTGAGEYGHPMLMSITEEENPPTERARQMFGPWLYEITTGEGNISDTGVAASARGYTSQALIETLPQSKCVPLVIECGTYNSKIVHDAVRNDNWLHLHGDPFSEEGVRIKHELLEAFFPSDPDWQEMTLLRSLQIFHKLIQKVEVCTLGNAGSSVSDSII